MPFSSSDYLPVHRNGETYKATTNELKEYLQTELPFVKKSGDEMTGDLTVNADTYLKDVYLNFADDGDTWLEWKSKTGEIRHKNQTKIEFTENGEMSLEGVVTVSRTPTEELDIANKYYVDDAIKNSGAALSPATSTQLGGVKIGSGVTVDSAGKISVSTDYASSSHTHSNYASSSHTHSNYASSSHGHGNSYVTNGNSSAITISKSGGVYYINGG